MTRLKLFLFSALIAMGGLPLYVHLPQYVGAELGISLAILGGVLLTLRIIDMIQDPLLGRLLDRYSDRLDRISMIAACIMAAGFIGVFAVRVDSYAISWLFLWSFLLFSGYSILYILLYRQSSALQNTTLPSAARIREIGLLVGVIIGSILPFLFETIGVDPYRAYGIALAMASVIIAGFAADLWRSKRIISTPISWRTLREIGAHKLLILIFFNSLPTAITSTLFLFFVSDRLMLADFTGGFLLLFFSATILGVFITSTLAKTMDARSVLLWSMSGAIVSFLWAFFLPSGAALWFAAICVLSGLFLGAELYVLPVLFANLLTKNNLQTGSAFGIWSFLSKLGLAMAAATMLPILNLAGYSIGAQNSATALLTLATCYALLPCILKLGALALTLTLPKGLKAS